MTTDLGAALTAIPQPETAVLDRLYARLVTAAGDDGSLDVAYRTLDSPVGELLLAATPAGVVRVAYAREDLSAVLARLAEQVSPRVLRAPARLDDAAYELEEYFAGRRHQFELDLDLQLAHAFRREVLTALREVPYGSTTSYSGLAAAAGRPTAVRAVGTACATNPLPILIPCHRVVRSDGSLGGYLGGPEAKQALLALEAA